MAIEEQPSGTSSDGEGAGTGEGPRADARPRRRTLVLDDGTDSPGREETQAPSGPLPPSLLASLPRPGDLFLGKYEIESLIGSGGMGSVLLARHRDLGAHFAIKVLHDNGAERSAIDRFKLEARACAAVVHPNIVRVFDCGERDGYCYIVMEHLRGESLSDRLRRVGRFSVEEVVRFVEAVCDALAVMHESGVVHRDLKPDNFIFSLQGDDEVVKILDFGVAKLATAGHRTEAGTVVGTPGYMSPEQCEAGDVDRRSDIYALGVIVFQLLTGRLPFDSDSPLAAMYLHVHQKAPSAHECEPGVPPAISAVVERMMAKSPGDRFQSAASCAEALRQAVGMAAPAASLGARRGWLALAAAGAAAAVVAGGVLYRPWQLRATEPDPAASATAAQPASGGATLAADRFVALPGGSAIVGSDAGDCREVALGTEVCEIGPDETPAHAVDLRPYLLARYEVTNREYAEFVRATGHAPPPSWRGTYPHGTDEFPVTNVDWNDAVAYAEWLSTRDGVAYRLPTEAEWEHAARGAGGRLFPWGDFWNAEYANGNRRREEGSPLPVDQAPNNTTDVSEGGVFALAGNVSEWTGSDFASYPGSPYAPTAGDRKCKIIRGGSFNIKPNGMRTTHRYWNSAGYRSFDLGFRLAADLPDAPAGPR